MGDKFGYNVEEKGYFTEEELSVLLGYEPWQDDDQDFWQDDEWN